MDNLKKINDIHSHQAGDRALKSLGEAIGAVGESGPACRLGGDEFLLFLRGVTREQAEEQVRGIIQGFCARVGKDRETADASLSAGMVMCTPADSFSRAYNKADKALYYVKQNGKNGLSFYREDSDSWQSGLVDLSRLINSIRHSGSYDGAMDVEYRQFTRLYEFFVHLRQRCHHPFRLVMITLKADDREAPRMEELEKAMYYMEQAIRQTVRSVDVLTRYSRQQYLIIMLDTDDVGVKTAVDRIFRSFFKMSGVGIFSPSYTVVEPEEEAPGQA
jgi:diguanylate cyclase (GGDEF)-like protein